MIRIKNHPTNDDCVILDVPSDLNSAMGTFQPARFAKEHRGYVCLVEHLDALRKFADFQHVRVIDERSTRTGIRTRPHECRHCSQPGSMLNPPKRCVSCGAPWDPITPDDIEHNEPISTTECVGCGHKNTGRFMFCSNCGQRMNHKPRAATPRLATPQRETLSEPVRVSTAIVEYAREHGGRKTMPVPVRPNTRQVIHQRPVVDVDLPAYPEDATGEPGASGVDLETGELFPANQPPQSDPPPPSAQEPEEEELPWYARPTTEPARSSSADEDDEENWWNKG